MFKTVYSLIIKLKKEPEFILIVLLALVQFKTILSQEI